MTMQGGGLIRAFTAEDAPEAAQLFQRVFRKNAREPSADLIACFRETFLTHGADSITPSRVHMDPDGRITGFIGALSGHYRLGERDIPTVFVGTLMVDEPDKRALAGARLLRAVAEGGQDITLSETANPLSRVMWEKTGGMAIAGFSLDFFNIFSPAACALDLAAKRHGWLRGGTVFARLADAAARRWTPVLPPTDPRLEQRDLDDNDAAACWTALAEHHAFRPAFDPPALAWRLSEAGRNNDRSTRIMRALTDRRGRTAGLYIYHLTPGRIAHALQILAAPGHMDGTVAALMDDARQRGAAGIRGRATPDSMTALGRSGCLFLQRSAVTIHTRDEQLANTIRQGNALITGLAGETWIRLIRNIGA